jgi:hypothetical protein
MENMFKKSLLAAALSAVAFNSAAATLNTTTGNVDVVGKEFLANETSVDLTGVVVALGAQYSVGDIIKFTVTGATVDVANSTPSIVHADVGTASTMTLGLLSNADGVLTYRVTAATGDHSNGTGDTLTLTGVKLTGASIQSASDITVAFSAETSTGVAIDAATTNTKKTMKVVDQYSTSAKTKLDETVSVAALRKAFVSGNFSDVLTVEVKQYTPGAGEAWVVADQGAAPTSVKYKVNGNWGFLDTNSDGKINASDAIAAPFAATTAGTVAIATDLASYTYTATTPAFGDFTNTITAATASKATTIQDQMFTVDTTLTYARKSGSAGSETASLAAGEWKLDGKKFTVPYIPYGDNTAVIFRITNTGSVSGNVSARYLNEKTSTWVDLGVIGVSNAGQVQNFRDELVNAIKASSGDDAGKVAVEITVNAPTANIKGYAAYKVVSETDRGFIGTF